MTPSGLAPPSLDIVQDCIRPSSTKAWLTKTFAASHRKLSISALVSESMHSRSAQATGVALPYHRLGLRQCQYENTPISERFGGLHTRQSVPYFRTDVPSRSFWRLKMWWKQGTVERQAAHLARPERLSSRDAQRRQTAR
jgi:hypothetical protein